MSKIDFKDVAEFMEYVFLMKESDGELCRDCSFRQECIDHSLAECFFDFVVELFEKWKERKDDNDE